MISCRLMFHSVFFFFFHRESKSLSASAPEHSTQRRRLGVQLVRLNVLHHRNMARRCRRHRRQRLRTIQRIQTDGHGRRFRKSETLFLPGQTTQGIRTINVDKRPVFEKRNNYLLVQWFSRIPRHFRITRYVFFFLFCPQSLCHVYGGHSSHVTNVTFLHDDSRLISIGGKDTSVLQWEIVWADAEWNRRVLFLLHYYRHYRSKYVSSPLYILYI